MEAKSEKITVTFMVLATSLISVLDLLGLLDNFSWLANKLPAINLLITSSVAGYLVVVQSRIRQIQMTTTEGTDKIINSLSGVSVIRFENSAERYKYWLTRMKATKHSIDDLSWGVLTITRRTKTAETYFRQYLEEITNVCKNTPELNYREIMTFEHGRRIERAKRMLLATPINYSLRFYDIPNGHMPPLMQFAIFDSEEVIFGPHRGVYLPPEGEFYLSVRHPLIVKYFQDYFNAIWQGAEILKEREDIRIELLEIIEKRERSYMD